MTVRLPHDSHGYIEGLQPNPALDTVHAHLPEQDSKRKVDDSARYVDTLGKYGNDPAGDAQTKTAQEQNSRKATTLCALSWKGVDTIAAGQVSIPRAQAVEQAPKAGRFEMFKRFISDIVNPAPAEPPKPKADKPQPPMLVAKPVNPDEVRKVEKPEAKPTPANEVPLIAKVIVPETKPAAPLLVAKPVKAEEVAKAQPPMLVAKPVEVDSTPKVEIVDGVVKPQNHSSYYFSTVVDKFINAFSWLFGSSQSSESAAIQPKKFSEEERKQLQNMLKTMSELLHQIKELMEDGEDNIKFDEMMKFMRVAKEEEGVMAKERMLQYFKQRQELHKEHFRKMEETIELAKKGKYGTRFAEFASAAQIFATAIGCSSPWGAIMLLFAVGNTIDSLFDDRFKKLLVSPFAKGDQDVEQKGVFYIKLTLGVLALGTMLRMASLQHPNPLDPYSGLKAGLQRATAVLKGSSMATTGYLENRTSNHNASMKDLKFQIQEQDAKVKATMKDLDRLITMIHDMYRQQWQEQSNKNDVTHGIFR